MATAQDRRPRPGTRVSIIDALQALFDDDLKAFLVGLLETQELLDELGGLAAVKSNTKRLPNGKLEKFVMLLSLGGTVVLCLYAASLPLFVAS